MPVAIRYLFLALIALVFHPAIAEDKDAIKVQIYLIWGTDDPASPNKKHVAAPADVGGKLKSKFKWKNYFEDPEERKTLVIQKNKTNSVEMSKKCRVEVKYTGNDQVEVTIYGEDIKNVKLIKALPEKELQVFGGEIEGSSAWFVVLKQVK